MYVYIYIYIYTDYLLGSQDCMLHAISCTTMESAPVSRERLPPPHGALQFDHVTPSNGSVTAELLFSLLRLRKSTHCLKGPNSDGEFKCGFY